MRARREVVVCALALTWSHRAAASEEDVVIERASNEMKCSELQIVHEAHKYWVAGCGQRRTYDCSSGTCATVAGADARSAAKSARHRRRTSTARA